MAGRAGASRPSSSYAEAFTEDEIVGLVRAGARDCVRRGDVARLKAAVERERARGGVAPGRRPRRRATRATATAPSSRRSRRSPTWRGPTTSGSRAYVSPQLLGDDGLLARGSGWPSRTCGCGGCTRRTGSGCCASSATPARREGASPRSTASSTARGGSCGGATRGGSLPGPDGKARFVRGFVLDITEQRLAEESLRKMRFFDQLTGLPNRVLLQNRLGRALAESVRTDRPLALLILALDRFREVTNTLGHHNGDLIVRELAVRLGDALGDADRVARLRGDEFGVLLPDADATFARQVGERILGSLERPFMVQRLPDRGLGQRRDGGGPGARDRGGDAAAPRRLGGAGRAQAGRRSERPLLVRAASRTTPRGSPCSASCAARSTATSCSCTTSRRWTSRPTRWWGRRRSCAGPTRSGASCRPRSSSRSRSRPGSSARSRAGCSTARRGRRGAGSGRAGSLPVAVNVSARSLHDGRIVDDVEEALLTHDLRPDRLQIEVTESAVMADAGRAADVLSSLTSRGVARVDRRLRHRLLLARPPAASCRCTS